MEASDVPSVGSPDTVTVVDPIDRDVRTRLGINCRSSSAVAALTALGEVASMAAGIAAAKGKTKAAVPLRPRNFLRDKSVSFIEPPRSTKFRGEGPGCLQTRADQGSMKRVKYCPPGTETEQHLLGPLVQLNRGNPVASLPSSILFLCKACQDEAVSMSRLP